SPTHASSLSLHDALPISCTVAVSHPMLLPSTAPPATSVGKCLPPVTRSTATPTAPAYSRIAFRARCGSCSRWAMTRYVVAAANASEACPEGNDWRFPGRGADRSGVPPGHAIRCLTRCRPGDGEQPDEDDRRPGHADTRSKREAWKLRRDGDGC